MKNKIKELVKELTIFHYIGIGTVLIILTIFVLISKVQEKNTEKLGNISKSNETSLEQLVDNSEKTVYYSEGDEDGAYNYIINGSDLLSDNSEMPYYYYSEINDVLNEKLQASGYTSRELTFISGSKSGTKYEAVFSISDCNDTVTVSNNMGLYDYNVVISIGNQ